MINYIVFYRLLTVVFCQEEEWKSVVGNLSSEVDRKLDRIEFGPFRDELEKELRAMTANLASLQRDCDEEEVTGDEAAGIRKQLLRSFSCLSCDKPLQMAPHK